MARLLLLLNVCWPKNLQSSFVIINYSLSLSTWPPLKLHHCFPGSKILKDIPADMRTAQCKARAPFPVSLPICTGSFRELEVCKGWSLCQWSVLEKNLHNCSSSWEMNVKLTAVYWRDTDELTTQCSWYVFSTFVEEHGSFRVLKKF